MPLFECGIYCKHWIEVALECLPETVWAEWHDKLAFLSTDVRDAVRLTRKTRENYEIIFLSERIIPVGPLSEAHPDVRYFEFCVLHEVAHAINDDLPPDEISTEQTQLQEERANRLAFDWFNSYLAQRAHTGLRLFTVEELQAAQAKTQAAMNALNKLN